MAKTEDRLRHSTSAFRIILQNLPNCGRALTAVGRRVAMYSNARISCRSGAPLLEKPEEHGRYLSPCLITSGSRYFCYRWVLKDSAIGVLGFLDGGVCDYNAPIVFEPTRIWQRGTIERVWATDQCCRVRHRKVDKMPADVCGVPNPIVSLTIPFGKSGYLTNITGSWEEFVAKRCPTDGSRANNVGS